MRDCEFVFQIQVPCEQRVFRYVDHLTRLRVVKTCSGEWVMRQAVFGLGRAVLFDVLLCDCHVQGNEYESGAAMRRGAICDVLEEYYAPLRLGTWRKKATAFKHGMSHYVKWRLCDCGGLLPSRRSNNMWNGCDVLEDGRNYCSIDCWASAMDAPRCFVCNTLCVNIEKVKRLLNTEYRDVMSSNYNIIDFYCQTYSDLAYNLAERLHNFIPRHKRFGRGAYDLALESFCSRECCYLAFAELHNQEVDKRNNDKELKCVREVKKLMTRTRKSLGPKPDQEAWSSLEMEFKRVATSQE